MSARLAGTMFAALGGLLLAAPILAPGGAQAPASQKTGAAADWWSPGDSREFPRAFDYPNPSGFARALLSNGPQPTAGHPFFTALGSNGRACVTCHQPADGMSLRPETARARWQDTAGADPLFAAIDGSDCPDLPQQERASHSLLLDHGLIRIERPWPPRDARLQPLRPDFQLEVVRDPKGCNSRARGPTKGSISVYRRPRPVANLKYLVAMGFFYDPKDGMPLDLDPETRTPASWNLLADARAASLAAQARDAMTSHLEISGPPDRAIVEALTRFELRISLAQQVDAHGGPLDADGASGGADELERSEPGQLGSIGQAVWSEFAAWDAPGLTLSAGEASTAAKKEFRESVARGARVFRDKTFLISDSAGINSPVGFGNPVRNSCVFCHNMSRMGNDVAPGQVDLGTTNQPFADPAPHLPLFKVTCLGDPHPHHGRVILTHDPGYALTTGKCADVGKITLQSMRGLASRAPYFSNGSAKTLREVIDYYERRYNIGYTEQEKQDLVNLMRSL